MRVIVASAALCATLALAMARLSLPRLADVLAIAAALCGLIAFSSALFSTLSRASRLPRSSGRP
jgi:hypothetical protein